MLAFGNFACLCADSVWLLIMIFSYLFLCQSFAIPSILMLPYCVCVDLHFMNFQLLVCVYTMFFLVLFDQWLLGYM